MKLLDAIQRFMPLVISGAIVGSPLIALGVYQLYKRISDAAFRRRKERFRALLQATSKIPPTRFAPQMGERLARYAGLEHNPWTN